jgi:hypothetical protein
VNGAYPRSRSFFSIDVSDGAISKIEIMPVGGVEKNTSGNPVSI